MRSHEELAKKAVVCIGSQTALAAALAELRGPSDPDASQSTISKWTRGVTKEIGHGNALCIDALTGGFIGYGEFYPLHAEMFRRIETPISRARHKAARVRWVQYLKKMQALRESRAA